uniref:Uncharacterized protein n=1 Tax=Anguilla anguilla TaxID=7936 RepID=A0A0E9PSI2_ANGAN
MHFGICSVITLTIYFHSNKTILQW